MRFILVFVFALVLVGMFSCKNTKQITTSEVKEQPQENINAPKEIIVEANRKPIKKPDFSVLSWTTEKDVLTVIVSYSGGCEEHDFNAYFSGNWLKSFPPQALVEIEHLNPNNDACRSLVKDTLKFSMIPLQYIGGQEVIVKWNVDSEKRANYQYGK